MTPETVRVTRRTVRAATLPSHLHHPSFDDRAAGRDYDPAVLADGDYFPGGYMPDEVTRDRAKRMHYAAHRVHAARTLAERAKWMDAYHGLRDAIVLGNRKLIFRAVRRRAGASNHTDDLIGDCQIVLIQAVAAFNPWLGIRFSTYAYTCLVRALARQSQKLCTDWLTRALPLDALPDGEPGGRHVPEPAAPGQVRIDVFLKADHPLLSPREKAIIARRFCLGEVTGGQTLEKVGRSMGLSKERVRQVQESALGKLRSALATPAACAS